MCLVYSIDSPGSYSHVSLGVESFHVIARRDCRLLVPIQASLTQYELNIEREQYSVTVVASVPWDMERGYGSNRVCYSFNLTFIKNVYYGSDQCYYSIIYGIL